MKKRVLMYFLAFALALCTGMTALALTTATDVKAEEDEADDGTFYYIVTEDRTATITGLVNPNVSTGINLVIPEKVGIYRVTKIAENAFKGNTYIKSVTFKEGLKEIGHHAFSGCTNLAGDIVFPASLESFETYWGDGNAFEGTMIKSVSFAEGSDTNIVISQGTFSNCTYLESVTIPNRVSEIEYKAFFECNNLKTLDIKDGLNKLCIGEKAFYNTSIVSLNIPSSVEEIGVEAFASCKRLTTVEFAKGVKEIGKSAFENCEALTKITLNEGLTKIGAYAFRECKSLSGDIVFPSTLVTFDEEWGSGEAFSGTHISSVSFTKGDTPVEIANGTFKDCSYLTKVTIANRVSGIDDEAFKNCSNLKTLIFEDGKVTKNIGARAFEKTLVDKVTFTSNITGIGDAAFYNCSNLSEIKFSEGLINIGYEAFKDCKKLKGDIVFPATLVSFGEIWGDGSQFSNTMINSISFAAGSVSPIAIPNKMCFGCNALTSVTIPDRVSSIGEYAFSECPKLSKVTFEAGELKKEIKAEAFSQTNLKEIEIPETVTIIGDGAFCQCEALESIKLNEGLTELGHSVFENCKNLKCDIVIPASVNKLGTYWGESYLFAGSAITSLTFVDSSVAIDLPGSICSGCEYLKYVVLPSRIKSIGENAFSNNISLVYVAITTNEYFDFTIGEGAFCGDYSLRAISIPNRIVSIAEQAFIECSDLKDVYVDKSEADYLDECLVENDGNETYVGAKFHFNSKGPDKWPNTKFTGWKTVEGKMYWYEEDVLQGYDASDSTYRGKEIYDPESDAWYWLDNVLGGAMATSKDVYQESLAGEWGDKVNEKGEKIGKWVRYDANGHMIKGWCTGRDENAVVIESPADAKEGQDVYYFDKYYGTMAKGVAVIDGKKYNFDTTTGILIGVLEDYPDGWNEIDGVKYWYEKGVRQGYKPGDLSYRGKEIYDRGTDAWYWLDNVLMGAVAKSKEVYQESVADADGNVGKWVRYDENGHMVKGWYSNENGTYFFDLTFGTMYKGWKNIDGVDYYFDEVTGVMR